MRKEVRSTGSALATSVRSHEEGGDGCERRGVAAGDEGGEGGEGDEFGVGIGVEFGDEWDGRDGGRGRGRGDGFGLREGERLDARLGYIVDSLVLCSVILISGSV